MRANALFSIKGKIDEEQVVQLSKETVVEETPVNITTDPTEDVVLDTEGDTIIEETPVIEESVVEESPTIEPNGEDGVVQ